MILVINHLTDNDDLKFQVLKLKILVTWPQFLGDMTPLRHNSQCTNKKMNLKQEAISNFAIQAFWLTVGIKNKKNFLNPMISFLD